MKQLDPASLRHYLPEHDLMCLGKVPVCYHCHHFNLFLDQTIDDTLGPEHGMSLRFAAAREFSYELLSDLCQRTEANTAVERIDVAHSAFAAMGHGRLDIQGDQTHGEGKGPYLHYGRSWHDKYGQLVNRSHPADAVAAGFGAAALEVAYEIERGTMGGQETKCVAMRAPECEFTYQRNGSAEPPGVTVDEAANRNSVKTSFGGKAEEQIQAIAGGLKEFTGGVSGDERGLVQAFGVYVTMHLTNYYNRLTYDAVAYIEEHAPRAIGVLESLLRESGHVCVFNTFGGIMLSPEWEGMVGAPRNDPAEVVAGCVAIGRALGFGHWTVEEIVPGERVVIRTPSSYEAGYHLTRLGVGSRPKEYFLEGAALAITQLAHRVDWEAKPTLTQRYYNDLFRGGVPWRAEQTHSLMCGHDYSEVVVTRTS